MKARAKHPNTNVFKETSLFQHIQQSILDSEDKRETKAAKFFRSALRAPQHHSPVGIIKRLLSKRKKTIIL